MRKELKAEVAKVLEETAMAYAISPTVRKLHQLILRMQDEMAWEEGELATLSKVRELVNPYLNSGPMATAGAGLWAPPPAAVPTVGPAERIGPEGNDDEV